MENVIRMLNLYIIVLYCSENPIKRKLKSDGHFIQYLISNEKNYVCMIKLLLWMLQSRHEEIIIVMDATFKIICFTNAQIFLNDFVGGHASSFSKHEQCLTSLYISASFNAHFILNHRITEV